MFKKIAGLFLAAAVMCSSAAITASAAEAEDDAAVAAAADQARFQPTVHQTFQLTLLQKLKQVMLLSLMLRSQAGIMLRQYSVTLGRLMVNFLYGNLRVKSVITTLQQVSLHMIFQRRTTRFLSQTVRITL